MLLMPRWSLNPHVSCVLPTRLLQSREVNSVYEETDDAEESSKKGRKEYAQERGGICSEGPEEVTR